jgi:hypothetical protein
MSAVDTIKAKLAARAHVDGWIFDEELVKRSGVRQLKGCCGIVLRPFSADPFNPHLDIRRVGRRIVCVGCSSDETRLKVSDPGPACPHCRRLQ